VNGAAVSKGDTGSPITPLLLTGPPDPPGAAQLATFGRFVGAWRLQWTGFTVDGPPEHAIGELAFDWVLGGRALQDVWVVPGRGQPGTGLPPRGFYGTTIRIFDPSIDAWRSTWINPVTSAVRRFIGRATAEGIDLLSDEDRPWLRWRFRDITDTSFRWTGDYSEDDGVTWLSDDEMLATRLTYQHKP
jgi:hypothetical protein